MKPIILIDKTDSASMNIFENIRNQDIDTFFLEKESIYNENIDKNPKLEDYDFFIFATKHQGKKEKMLSLHVPGNWNKAEFGGQAGKICQSSSTALKIFFIELNKNLPGDWTATLEVTHHGPYLEKPCLFIEIGGTKKDWTDKEAGKALSKTILNSINQLKDKPKLDKKYISCIGIGGPHYSPNFNKIQLKSNYALAHIIPEYHLPLTEEMVRQAIDKTIEKPTLALLDWKGLGKSEEKQKTLNILDSLNIKYTRTSNIEKSPQ